MKQIWSVLILLLLVTACATKTTETLFFDQVSYTKKESFLTRKKYPFNPDEKAREPRRTSESITLIKDSTAKVRIRSKQRMKRHPQHGKFYLVQYHADTSKTEASNFYIRSEKSIIGSFLPAENNMIPVFRFDKSIEFYENGNCLYTYKTIASDSPISSLHQQLGLYKVLNDTVHVVYFQKRQQRIPFNKSEDSLSIALMMWDIMEPQTSEYVLSMQNDTTKIIPDNSKGFPLIAADSTVIRLNSTTEI